MIWYPTGSPSLTLNVAIDFLATFKTDFCPVIFSNPLTIILFLFLSFCKNTSFFEFPKKHHHHIACVNCDTIEDFENKDVEKILEKIGRNSSKFINIKSHSLELFGFCKKCKI